MIKNRIINTLEAAMIYFCWLAIFLTVDQFINKDIPAETAELHDEIVAIAAAEEIETPSAPALIDTPIIFEQAEYKTFYDITQSLDYIAVLTEHTGMINNAINSKEYTKAAEVAMNIELNRINDIIASIEFDVDQYSSWEQEYYYAAKTYEFFRQNGYSAEVACAIIGNMMIETSGGTLALKPNIYSPGDGFYGLCQWSLYYRPEADGISFEEQLEYLHNDMENEFKIFGFCYKDGFTYEDFLSMDDVSEAAIAFAKVYERCGSGTYELRADCAKIAYEYFVE